MRLGILVMVVMLAALCGLPACAETEAPVALQFGPAVGLVDGDVEPLLALGIRASRGTLDLVDSWQAKGDLQKAGKFLAKSIAQNGRLFVVNRIGTQAVKVSLGVGFSVGVPELKLGIYGGPGQKTGLLLGYDLLR